LSRVYAVEGVRSAVIRENTASSEQTIDGVVMSAHSVYVAADGGQSTSIATALLESKSAGAQWVGNTTIPLVEPYSGQTYNVKFERPDEIQVYARVTAKFNSLPAQDIIPQAIVAYANGELEGDAGFGIGRSVSPFELAGAVKRVEPRIFVTLVELSTDGITYGAGSIPITLQEVARINENAVTVISA
jgi:hypothetical protein